jgi:hypothetical protein
MNRSRAVQQFVETAQQLAHARAAGLRDAIHEMVGTPARRRRRKRLNTRWNVEAAYQECRRAGYPGTQEEVAVLLRCGERTLRDLLTAERLQWPPPWPDPR